jgi:hypothetical protein
MTLLYVRWFKSFQRSRALGPMAPSHVTWVLTPSPLYVYVHGRMDDSCA